MRFQKIGLTTVVLCTVGIQQSFSIDIVTKEKPNIVFILADDLGWTDLGVMGSDYYETPNIDRLATEGILFDNAYAAAANSAPSRACMMTGMYTPRHGVYTVSPPDRGDRTKRKYIAIPNVEDVCADFVTMAEALQEQGYQCGHIGKWHLGEMRTVQDPCHRDLYGMWAVIEQELPILIFIPIVCLIKVNVMWD